MSYSNIATAIYNLLGEITELKAVYSKEPAELLKYPCATVSSFGHQNIFSDTAANKRKYSHIIRIYYKQDSDNTAETILRSIADLVITKVEGNLTLQSTCDFATPSEGVWKQGEREVPVKVVEITVDAYKRVNR